MAAYYLINTTTLKDSKILAGETVSDAATITALGGAGGILCSTSEPVVAAAVPTVLKLRLKGADENLLTQMMMAAWEEAGGGLRLRAVAASIAASATLILNPQQVDRPGTILAATFMCKGTPAAGESVVLQARKNGTNITGATITYNSGSSPNTLIAIPNMVGVALVPGDIIDFVDTYTAGGGPALGTGQNGVFNLTVNVN